MLSFLRVIAESTVAVMITLAVVDRVEGTWQPFLVAIAIMALISFAVVGVSPGTLGAQHSSRVALAAAPTTAGSPRAHPFSCLLIALATPSRRARAFPRARSRARASCETWSTWPARGVMEDGEREMIHSVFELGDTIAREVMVPRTEMVWIDAPSVCRRRCSCSCARFSRIPVIGEDVDDVLGVLYLKDVVRRLNADPAPGRFRWPS